MELVTQLISSMPEEWRGTTFNNSNLLGRDEFAARFDKLVGENREFSTDDLISLGNAEDYLRVATNVCTTLEILLARKYGLTVSQVFTFSSARMGLAAILLTVSAPVHLFTGHEPEWLSARQQEQLALLGGELVVHTGAPAVQPGCVVVCLEGALCAEASPAPFVDAVIGRSTLYLFNTAAVVPASILRIRKRMSTPITTPAAEAELRRIAGEPRQTRARKRFPHAIALLPVRSQVCRRPRPTARLRTPPRSLATPPTCSLSAARRSTPTRRPSRTRRDCPRWPPSGSPSSAEAALTW